MKRFFAWMLIAALLLAVLPQTVLPAFAADVTGTCGTLSWSFSEDGTLTFSGEGAMPDYTSSACKTVPWKAYSAQIKTVIFDSGVTRIGSYAFYNADSLYPNLTAVEIKGAETVGSYAFKYCRTLQTVSFGVGLKTIETNAFAYCSAVTAFPFSAGLQEIGAEAFNHCEAVETVALPEGLLTIDYSAFGNCYALTDVTIPASVNAMGVHVFNNCKNETVHGAINSVAYMYCLLGSIPFDALGTVDAPSVYAEGTDGDITWTFYSDGTLKFSGEGDMTDYTSDTYTSSPWITYSRQVTGVVIGEGITHVGDYTFLNTSNTYYPKLTAVVIKGDASIGEGAFRLCNLTSASFEGDISEIGKDAFSYCRSLETVTFDGSLGEIGYAAFRGCSALTELELPDGVTAIGEYAFSGCSMITEIYFHGDAPVIGASSFSGVKANAYYHLFKEGWTEDVMLDYGGKLTWESLECSHAYDAVVTEPTCLEGGYTTYTCSKCGDTYTADETEPLGHDYVGVVTKPTCLEKGYTTYTCSRCEDTYTGDETDALGHDYVGVVTKPTCTEKGYTTFTCSRCEDTYVGDETDALGHTDVIDEAVEPTCTQTGLTEGSHCAVCGETIVAQETVPMADHDYVADITAPTCTKDGSVTYTCSCCGDTYTEILPAVECPTKDYKDVPNTSNWGHAGIDFCVDRGIMGSNSGDSLVFEPGTVCTRAMIVTILYRLSGSPETAYENAFPDVPDGKWYSVPVIWGYQNDVVNGFEDGAFRPEDQITREQMAAILMRYAQNVAHKDTSASTSLDAFPDAADVTWSRPYVQWAVAVEMLLGTSRDDGQTILDPQGQATRVQVASLMMRFIQNIIEQ